MAALMMLAGGFVLAGCASRTQPAEASGTCRYDREAQTLSVTGSIDADLAACIAGHADALVLTLRLDSPGGLVEPALDAAEIVARWRPHMVVEGLCASSCANYWLPLARRITVLPDAAVILHGSIDQGFVAMAAPETRDRAEATAQRQRAFAARHGVHPGWLLSRSQADYESRRLSAHLTGALAGNGPITRMSYLLVEEEMMRSCLRDGVIDPFDDTLAERMRTELLTRLVMAWQGVFLSGSLECA